MIYIDKFGHLVSDSDSSGFDFNCMLKYLGVSKDQFVDCSLPHYTLTPEQSSAAVIYGARYVDESALIRVIETREAPREIFEYSLNSQPIPVV